MLSWTATAVHAVNQVETIRWQMLLFSSPATATTAQQYQVTTEIFFYEEISIEPIQTNCQEHAQVSHACTVTIVTMQSYGLLEEYLFLQYYSKND